MKQIIIMLITVCLTQGIQAQTVITAKDAKAHIGETLKVTDKVFGGKLLQSNMTLIDLGGQYPNELLTIMIPAAAREKFSGKPEVDWEGKTVTVTGKVIDYKGKPEIIVETPTAIAVH